MTIETTETVETAQHNLTIAIENLASFKRKQDAELIHLQSRIAIAKEQIAIATLSAKILLIRQTTKDRIAHLEKSSSRKVFKREFQKMTNEMRIAIRQRFDEIYDLQQIENGTFDQDEFIHFCRTTAKLYKVTELEVEQCFAENPD